MTYMHTHANAGGAEEDERVPAPVVKKRMRSVEAKASGMHSADMHAHARTHTHTHAHTRSHTLSGSNLDPWVPAKVGVHQPWMNAKKKIEKDAAAKHNDGLAGRIFQQVVRKKGNRMERREYTLDTLKWYVRVYYKSDMEKNVKDAHTARARIREYYKRGTSTLCLKEISMGV
jgi:hypothetical protein